MSILSISSEKVQAFCLKNNLNLKKFEDYLHYLSLRDEVAELRIQGKEHTHPYFATHPSCQNRRYMDRESQYYIFARNEYAGNHPISDAVFHLIFRKHSTYESVRSHFGDYPGNLINKIILPNVINFILTLNTPFTGAYLVPHRDKKCSSKVEGWLKLFSEFNFEKITELQTTKECFTTLKSISGFGDFLAMQFATELSWLNETQFSCNEFVIPGNGAVRGLNKLEVEPKDHVKFLHALVELQPLSHPSWLPMTLMDYQNTFCEFDKYTRYLGGYENYGRERMKRLRKPHTQPITRFYTTAKLQQLIN